MTNTHVITTYTAEELKEVNPSAYDKALERFQQWIYEDPAWVHETVDSMKEVFKASGIELKDWSIDYNSWGYSYVKIEFPVYNWSVDQDCVRDLTGQRAIAWLENNLFYNLRERRKFKDRVKRYSEKWHSFNRYGKIPDCPFTGYFADDYFLECLIKAIAEGDTLAEAYEGLAQECSKLIAEDIEAQASEEEFLAQDHEFTEDGELY